MKLLFRNCGMYSALIANGEIPNLSMHHCLRDVRTNLKGRNNSKGGARPSPEGRGLGDIDGFQDYRVIAGRQIPTSVERQPVGPH